MNMSLKDNDALSANARQISRQTATSNEGKDDDVEEGIERPKSPSLQEDVEMTGAIPKLIREVSTKITSSIPQRMKNDFRQLSDAMSTGSAGGSMLQERFEPDGELDPAIASRHSLISDGQDETRLLSPGTGEPGGSRFVTFKRSRLKTKRFWAGCCSLFFVTSILLWFIAIIPIARHIIAVKTLSAPCEVLSSTLGIEETSSVIEIKSLRAHVPMSAWDMGFPLNLFSFEATIPPLTAKLFVHIGNGTRILEAGNFSSKTEVTLKSWEDFDASMSGTMTPVLSSLTELFEEVMGAPVMRVHIETTTDVHATMMGIFPVKIPQAALVTGIQTVPAMNGFKDNPMTVTSIDRIVTKENALEATLTAEIKNPTPFSMKVGFPLTLDGTFNGTRLGNLTLDGMELPPYGMTSKMEVNFVYVKDSEQADLAFHQAIQAFLAHPHEFSPAGKDPIVCGALAPKYGKASNNPLINAAMTDKFKVNATLKLPTVKMIHKVDVKVPVISIWNGAVATVEMENPAPTTIFMDGLDVDLYYKSLSGVHLYRLNRSWSLDDVERPHIPPGINSVSLQAGMSGVDPHAASIVKDLISRLVHGKLHNMTVGARGYFNLTVGGHFQTQIPYSNDEITANLHYGMR